MHEFVFLNHECFLKCLIDIHKYICLNQFNVLMIILFVYNEKTKLKVSCGAVELRTFYWLSINTIAMKMSSN